MNNKELVKVLAEKLGMSQKSAAEVLGAVVETIVEGMVNEGSVKVSGLGSFTTVEKAACVRRNPSTGEQIEVPAKIAPKFKFVSAVKEAVNA